MHQCRGGYTYQAPAIFRVFQKICIKFTHHNLETLRNSHVDFSKNVQKEIVYTAKATPASEYDN